MGQQMNFGDIARKNGFGGKNNADEDNRPRGPSVDAIINKDITITKLEMGTSSDGNVLWIMTEEYAKEGWIRASSKVLYKQATDDMLPLLAKGNTIKTRIETRIGKESRRKYHTFV